MAPHDDVAEFRNAALGRRDGVASTERHSAEGRTAIPKEFFKVLGALAIKIYPESSQNEDRYRKYAREIVSHLGKIVTASSKEPETMLLAFHLLRRLDAVPEKPPELTARGAISLALMFAGTLQAEISPALETWISVESKGAQKMGWASFTSTEFADHRLAFARALDLDFSSPPRKVLVERAAELDKFMRSVRAKSGIQWPMPGPRQAPAHGGLALQNFMDVLTSTLTTARCQGPVKDAIHAIPTEYFEVFVDLAMKMQTGPSDSQSAYLRYVQAIVHQMYLFDGEERRSVEYIRGRPVTLLLAFELLSRVVATGTKVKDGGRVKVANLSPGRAAFAALMLAWKFQNDGSISIANMHKVQSEASRYDRCFDRNATDIAQSEQHFFKALRYDVAPIRDSFFFRACELGTEMRRQAEKHHSRARASG